MASLLPRNRRIGPAQLPHPGTAARQLLVVALGGASQQRFLEFLRHELQMQRLHSDLELGFLTPLVGINIFLASYRFKRPVLEVCRATLPMMAILGIGVLLITYVPWLTTGILQRLGRI